MRTIFWTSWWMIVGWIAAAVEAPAQTCGPNGCPLPPRPAAAAHPAVCRVIHSLPGGLRCLGSGVLVDKEGQYGLVITCQHLFRDGPGATQVIFPDGQAFEARLVQQDPAADLAALLIAQPSADPVPVADAPPQPGEPVQSCGYGPDGRYWCNQGRVVGYARTASAAGWETLELTGRARQGDSGGPVFNAQGQLVAVLWGTDGRSVSAAYCGRVDRFLQQTGRYLLPWNARNDPAHRTPANPQGGANVPGSGGPAGSAGDLSRIEARLDRILDLLNQGRSGQAGQTPPPGQQVVAGGAIGVGVNADGDSKAAGSPVGSAAPESTRSEASVFQQAVQHLVGELGNLPERIQARIEKVQSAGAQTAPETIRAYAQDFLAEKLADGSLGWTMGKLLGAALGLSGPVALGLMVGAWLVSRRIGRKVQAGEPLLVQQLADRLGALLGRSPSSGSPIGQTLAPSSGAPTS